MNTELYDRVLTQLSKCNTLQAGFSLRNRLEDLMGAHLYVSTLAGAETLSDKERQNAVLIMIRLKEVTREVLFTLRFDAPDPLVYAVRALVSETSSQAEQFLKRHHIEEARAHEELKVIANIATNIGLDAMKATL